MDIHTVDIAPAKLTTISSVNVAISSSPSVCPPGWAASICRRKLFSRVSLREERRPSMSVAVDRRAKVARHPAMTDVIATMRPIGYHSTCSSPSTTTFRLRSVRYERITVGSPSAIKWSSAARGVTRRAMTMGAETAAVAADGQPQPRPVMATGNGVRKTRTSRPSSVPVDADAKRSAETSPAPRPIRREKGMAPAVPHLGG